MSRALTIDDVLLGPLEDVGSFHKLGNVELKAVYAAFGTYVDIVMSNRAVLDYIQRTRVDEAKSDFYVNLERLYQELAPLDESENQE